MNSRLTHFSLSFCRLDNINPNHSLIYELASLIRLSVPLIARRCRRPKNQKSHDKANHNIQHSTSHVISDLFLLSGPRAVLCFIPIKHHLDNLFNDDAKLFISDARCSFMSDSLVKTAEKRRSLEESDKKY